MMNAIRAGSSVFRTNCTILYKQTVTPQCLFCSSSQNGDNSNKGDNSDSSDKKQNIGKPVNIIRKNNQHKLWNSRAEQGKSAVLKLLQTHESDSGKKEDNVNVIKILKDTPGSADSFDKHQKEQVQVPVASKAVTQKSNIVLMKLLNEAAVELGGDVETTGNELLKAYNSVKDKKYEYKPREMRIYPNYMSKTPTRDETHAKNPIQVNRISCKDKLDIFNKNVAETEQEPQLKMWHKLNERTLLHSVVCAPTNYFEQLMVWTLHGKLWYFPIDNEQGMELERNTDFTEHVFLEEHLEPWCPKDGPLRHFMELVTVGLSKNPYISVAQKKEHILWYRDYFESKRKLLKEVGALDPVSESKTEIN